MDKIGKVLKKLSNKELKQIKLVLNSILVKNFKNLDVKKLKSRQDIFRVRKGDIRIIYRLTKEKVYILAIEKRNEKTYKKT